MLGYENPRWSRNNLNAIEKREHAKIFSRKGIVELLNDSIYLGKVTAVIIKPLTYIRK